MKLPVDPPYRITGVYGQTGGPYGSTPHSGTDFVSDNRRVYAPHAGRVIAGKDSRNGNYLVIDNGAYRSTLSHFARRSVKGGTVKAGQYLGIMGNSGYVTGVHLHWTLRVNGTRVDPEKYLPKETQGENMAQFGTTTKRLSRAVFGRVMGEAEFNKHHKGKTWKRLIDEWFTSKEGTNYRNRVSSLKQKLEGSKEAISTLENQVATRDNRIKELNKQVVKLKAAQGDATKWDTLKSLLRELIGV